MRSVSGGSPAIAHTHGSQTKDECGAITRFWPTKLLPIHLSRGIDLGHSLPHTQHVHEASVQPSTEPGDV